MYPHVVQFETRRREFERELQLIRERTQAQASSKPSRSRTEPGFRGANNHRSRLATGASQTLEPELTIERT